MLSLSRQVTIAGLHGSPKLRMPKVIVRQPVNDLCGSAACPKDMHPLLWQIYRARGVVDPAELERELASLIPPHRLDGLESAVDICDASAAGAADES